MIELLVGTKDLKRAMGLILAGRNEYMLHDTADFHVIADTLEICSTGTSTRMAVSVAQAGYARMPLEILKRLRRAAGTFKLPRLRLRIEAGRARIENFGFSHPDIELKPIGARIADLPIDARPLDALALQKLYSAEELAESGLAARVLDAQQALRSAIDSAAFTLRGFGITTEAIRQLVENQIATQARLTLSAATTERME